MATTTTRGGGRTTDDGDGELELVPELEKGGEQSCSSPRRHTEARRVPRSCGGVGFAGERRRLSKESGPDSRNVQHHGSIWSSGSKESTQVDLPGVSERRRVARG